MPRNGRLHRVHGEAAKGVDGELVGGGWHGNVLGLEKNGIHRFHRFKKSMGHIRIGMEWPRGRIRFD
jgi:hypothetical protein